MFMFEGRTTPDGIIGLVIDEIDRLGGLRKAFPHDGLILLYSGPDREFFPSTLSNTLKIVGPEITNGDRTDAQKQEIGWTEAKRIDDTPIGNFLFVQNSLYGWLKHVHTDAATGRINATRIDLDAKEVMTFVSALFARAAHGHVKTAICGASRERVFYETEIPHSCGNPPLSPEALRLVQALIDNKKIETINCVPMDVFRALYKRDGVEAVYQRICQTELRERWLFAHSTGNDNDYADYLDRLEVHRINQFELNYKHAPAAASSAIYQALQKPEAERRVVRQERLQKFAATKSFADKTTNPVLPLPMRRVAGIPGLVVALP